MVSAKEIQATCDDIIREFAPRQVILFGSYAYGTPTEESDVDLFVVMAGVESGGWQQQAREMKKRLPERFRLDLHVRSPEELAYRVSHNDWFLCEILEKGDVLYDTENVKTYRRARAVSSPGQLELAEEALVPIWQETGAMNPLTLEWVELAELDYAVIQMFLPQLATRGSANKICFNAQQCIEKYLKAWLQEANRPTPRTHDLNELLDLIVPSLPAWEAWRADFSAFGKYAKVEKSPFRQRTFRSLMSIEDVRYPGHFPTGVDAERAVRICDEVRRTIRDMLKLTDNVSSAG